MRIADRRSRSTFWIDDGFIDRCGPWLGRFPCGTVAIAAYVALARHADRAAEAWPSVASLASLIGAGRRSTQYALQLLELGGLIAVLESYDAATDKRLTNTYVLLDLPERFPELSVKPDEWPAAERKRVRVHVGRDGRRMIEDARTTRKEQNTCSEGCTICTGDCAACARGGCRICTLRARDDLSEGKPIEGQGPSDDAFARYERYMQRQEKRR